MQPGIRCSYCLQFKTPGNFKDQGDHVIPAALGASWVDPRVCDECNRRANKAADELIAKDSLVRFLREAYQVPDRYGRIPPPCQFSIATPLGGVVRITLTESGPTFEAGMPAVAMKRLGVSHSSDQLGLGKIVASHFGLDNVASIEAIRLARAAQEFATTPTHPTAWARFMAKLALACGREAYGDDWLDSEQAKTLSEDLLGTQAPRFPQRTHYPPVDPVWPYEPPSHRLWIEAHKGKAALMIVLFGQVQGAVPMGDSSGSKPEPSAWTVDPHKGTVHRSTYPAVKYGTATARLAREGHNVVFLPDDTAEVPFFYVEDGPDGPADLPIPTVRADSPAHGFDLFRDLKRARSPEDIPSSKSDSN